MRRAALLGLSLGCAAGCDSCRREQPEAPFAPVTSLPEVRSAPSASASEPPRPPAFVGAIGRAAPAKSTDWTLDDLRLRAPAGRVFSRALVADLDGDGTKDALAWTVPVGSDAASGRGSAVWFPAGAAPREILAAPEWLPAGPGCTSRVELNQTGPSSVTLEIAAACATPTADAGATSTSGDAGKQPPSATRAIAVLVPAAQTPLLAGIRVNETKDEPLRCSSVSLDRNGDGRDDAEIEISAGEGTSARFVWLSLGAGASRDLSEPGASFARHAGGVLASAGGKKSSKGVAARVVRLRRLATALCKEWGAPRVVSWSARELECGAIRGAGGTLTLAEIQAALASDDVLEATGAFSRDGWYGAGMDARQRERAVAAIERAAAPRKPARARSIEGVAPLPMPNPGWSPLAFEPDGTLLVRERDRVRRIGMDGEARDADAATPEPWVLEASAQDGSRLGGVSGSCEGQFFSLLFSSKSGAPAPAASTSVLAPRSCTGRAAPRATPVTWGQKGLEALVAGSLVGTRSTAAERSMLPHAPGSPLSPDGRLLAVATPLGVLVTGGAKPELWRDASVMLPAGLLGCTVANGSKAVACLDGGKLRLLVAAP